MKNILILLAVLLASFSHAQNEKENIKYQGLLWEITGNGLEKTSYLYGTMHVSRKIAFNLDDVFFEALDQADMVAVESMPDNWLDDLFEDGRVGYGGSVTRQSGGRYGGYNDRNFYSSAFKINQPNKMDIMSGMFGQYQLINGLLYRSDGNVDFEEDTYLDMFIYQTGKRFNKGTYSLENHKETRDLVDKASQNVQKEEIDEWLKERMEKKGVRYFDIIQDAYRDRNIGLIDSVNRAINTKHYLEYMLFKRNENMVDSMETLMKNGSLFTGVGAAHLPGEEGMIDMLRKRGYTLKPVFSGQTEKGKKIKTKIEEHFIAKKYTSQTTADGFITMDMPYKLYEFYANGGSISISPDFDNGAYITLARLYTFNRLRKTSEQLTEKDLEKLLFEFIPGEILSKKVLTAPYPGFDIENVTKTGNHQRHVFYVTPLEIIIVKMDGKKDFVKKESDKVFSSIKFEPNKNKKNKVVSHFDGFEVEMEGYTIINNAKYVGKRFIQAYDDKTDHYSFLSEVALNDASYIEEDSFELYYLMDQFCENLETELDVNGKYVIEGKVPSFYSFTVLDSSTNKQLHLCTKLLGERFYLAGFLGEKSAATDFFKTIDVRPYGKYDKKYEEQVDTNLFYTVHSLERKSSNDYYGGGFYRKDKEKAYEKYTKNQSYSINSNENIYVRLIKFHDWKTIEHIDTLWSEKRENLDKAGFKLVNTTAYTKDSSHYFEGLATREGSQRAIKFKYIQKHGTLYLIRAVVQQDVTPSPFIDTFFQTFTPKDTVIGISPLIDKSQLLFDAIEQQDSILLDSKSYIDFETKHFAAVKKLFLEKEFDDDWKFLKDELFKEICYMDYDKVMPFLEQLYLDSYENSYYQNQILQVLIRKKSKAANLKILKLLEEDIPITDNAGAFLWGMLYRDAVKVAPVFFPRLLEYATISDYKSDIHGTLASLSKDGRLSHKKYKSFKKQFLNEGKIELKRAIGKEVQSRSKNKKDYRYRQNYEKNKALDRYVNLLYPFRKEKKVANFLDRVKNLDNPAVQMNLIELQLLNKELVDGAVIQKLAENPKQRYSIYNTLRKYKALDLMQDSLKSEVALAKGLLKKGKYYSYNESIDTVYYLKSEKLKISGQLHTVHYFAKKVKQDNSYNRSEKKEKTFLIAFTWEAGEKLKPNNNYKIERILEENKTEAEVLKELHKQIQLKDRERLSNDSSYYRRNSF